MQREPPPQRWLTMLFPGGVKLQKDHPGSAKGSPAMPSTEPQPTPLEGLLLVEAYQDEEGTVDIYSVRNYELVFLESGGEPFARTWLGHHARRLVAWRPRRLHDDLSGIWCRRSPAEQP